MRMLTNLRQLLLTAGSLCLLLVLGMCEPAVIKYSIPPGEFQSYSNFVMDKTNSKIIVATTNSLLKLSYDLRVDFQLNATPDATTYQRCFLGFFKAEEECQNYHRVLLLPVGTWQISASNGTWNVSQTILTCSSNAFSPLCHYRDRSSLKKLTSFSSTAANSRGSPSFAPYGPYRWIPSLWTSTGQMVVATPTDSNLVDFDIIMSRGPFTGQVQVQATTLNQRLWFNKNTPRAVSMYEIGEYIYLFFREEAVEAKNRVVYSRVARVCKNDMGVLHDGRRLFTTFVKARLTCSTSANSGRRQLFSYNNVYDALYLPSQKKLYASFQPALNAPLGSAICTFTFGLQTRDLGNVFKGRYLEEVGANHFSSALNHQPFTCASGRSLEDALRFQLMESTVKQSSPQPVVKVEGYAFQRFLVNVVDGSSEVFFVTATKQSNNSLLLLKILALVTSSPTHHIIQTTVLAEGSAASTHFVTKMEQLGSGPDAHIYIGTETDLYRVPVQNCSSHSTCCQCVAARDPYCAYDTSTKMCHGRDLDSSSDNDVQDLVGGKCKQCLKATIDIKNDVEDKVSTVLIGLLAIILLCLLIGLGGAFGAWKVYLAKCTGEKKVLDLISDFSSTSSSSTSSDTAAATYQSVTH